MNEKFSELYHRAWTLAEFDDEYKEKPTYERRCVVQSKIFAELIIQECVTAVEEIPKYYKETLAQEIERNTIYDCITTIKSRFGIKE